MIEQICTACGQYVAPVQTDIEGKHLAKLCYSNPELTEYEGTFKFYASKPLTEEQIAQLLDIISLQIIEPVDENQEDEDYATNAVRVEIKEVK